jgi:hypothetical protein
MEAHALEEGFSKNLHRSEHERLACCVRAAT